MTESLSIDDFDPSILTSDFTSTEEISRTGFKNTIKDLFGKQVERQKDRDIEQEKQLRAAIQESDA